MFSNTPKGRCQKCSRKFNLVVKGRKLVIPAHVVNWFRCEGTNKEPA